MPTKHVPLPTRSVEEVKNIKFYENDIPNLEVRGYITNHYRKEVVDSIVVEQAPHQALISVKPKRAVPSAAKRFKVWVPWNYYLIYTSNYMPYIVHSRGKQRVNNKDKFIPGPYLNTSQGAMCYGNVVTTLRQELANLSPERTIAGYMTAWWQGHGNNDYPTNHSFWDYFIEQFYSTLTLDQKSRITRSYYGHYNTKQLDIIIKCLELWEELSLADVLKITDDLCKEKGKNIWPSKKMHWMKRRKGSLNSNEKVLENA